MYRLMYTYMTVHNKDLYNTYVHNKDLYIIKTTLHSGPT